MMVNYRVEKDDILTQAVTTMSEGRAKGFSVIENESGHIMKSGLSKAAAQALCRSLNFGSGFDGNTPAFFLKKIEKVEFTEENFYK
jgi:hypothetical protein